MATMNSGTSLGAIPALIRECSPIGVKVASVVLLTFPNDLFWYSHPVYLTSTESPVCMGSPMPIMRSWPITYSQYYLHFQMICFGITIQYIWPLLSLRSVWDLPCLWRGLGPLRLWLSHLMHLTSLGPPVSKMRRKWNKFISYTFF